MTNFDFTQYGFSEGASQQANAFLDFTRCERPNGSTYGTGGKCRKGTEVAPAERKESRLTPGQLARQAATSKIIEQHQKIISAHKEHAASLRKEGRRSEAEAADEVIAHYTRLMKEAEKIRDNPPPDPKMSIGLDTEAGKWFANRMGFRFSEAVSRKVASRLDSTYDFTRCERPDGSTYGTGGKCRKGVEVKMPKPPGIGPMSSDQLEDVKKEAKSNVSQWDSSSDKAFDEIYSKAETVKHLGAIHRAVIKAIDNDDTDIKEGHALAIKKAMEERLKVEERSEAGAKREKELEAMTPEERKRDAFRRGVEAGIKRGIVSGRL